MQLADRHATKTHPTTTAGGDRVLSGLNQGVFQQLKLSLSLGLRRQIFLAVCDDLELRNRLAAQLYAELAYPTQTTPSSTQPLPSGCPDSPSLSTNGIRVDTLAVTPSLPVAYPRLVSLNLNLADPNPMVQISQWLAQYPPPRNLYPKSQPPGFQILGAERLMRQSAIIQRQFLESLQQIDQFLPQFESTLLLWLPRPWLHAIQQSAPALWQWHTALFEFEGDPTPAPLVRVTANSGTSAGTVINPSPTKLPKATNKGSQKQIADSVSQAGESRKASPSNATPASPVSNKEVATAADTGDNLWELLDYDLAQLNHDRRPGSEKLANNAPSAPSQSRHLDSANGNGSDRPPQSKPSRPNPSSTNSPVPVPAAQPQNSTTTEPRERPAPPAVPCPYPLHTVQDLAELVLAVAMQDTEAADDNGELLQALQTIEQLHTQKAPSEALAEAYRNLGNLYRDRVEQGDSSTHTLLIAVCAYEQVLQWLENGSPLWSDVLNDIGNLYWMLSRAGESVEKSLSYLERAIAAYQYGLTHTDPATRSQSYAMIQNNLGSALGDLARYRNPVESLEKSVTAYEEALRYRRMEDDPARYAATQNNLGTAYWNLAQHHQPVHSLKRAIAAYTEALRYYSPTCEPLHYAMIQNNLGTAYWNLAQHKQSAPDEDAGEGRSISPTEWLQRAITAYRHALQYRTVEVVPAAYAATQNNLGTAHWHLANLSGVSAGDRWEHLQQAITAYKAAIAAINYLTSNGTEHSPALTFDPAATYNNLGLAYYQAAVDRHSQSDEVRRSDYLEFSLDNHLQALQDWQQNPDYFQTALGYVLQVIRTFHDEFGIKGQNLALSKIPPSLLPEVMKRL